jgi:hypothetical protein
MFTVVASRWELVVENTEDVFNFSATSVQIVHHVFDQQLDGNRRADGTLDFRSRLGVHIVALLYNLLHFLCMPSDGDGTVLPYPLESERVRQGLPPPGTVAVYIPSCLTNVSGAAFQSCSISVTTIPRSVISMEPPSV